MTWVSRNSFLATIKIPFVNKTPSTFYFWKNSVFARRNPNGYMIPAIAGSETELAQKKGVSTLDESTPDDQKVPPLISAITGGKRMKIVLGVKKLIPSNN